VRLAAAGAVLQTIEAPIPYPVPGARLGIGNVVTLVALTRDTNLDFQDCLVLVFSRVIASSFLTGSFLSPAFVISIIASPLSFIAMFLVSKAGIFSLIGVSVVGAVVHNLAQLAVVYLFFIHHTSILTGALPAILTIAGVISGVLTGFAASRFLVSNEKKTTSEAPLFETEKPQPDRNLLKNSPSYSWGKISLAFILILCAVLVKAQVVLLLFDVALMIFIFAYGCRFSVKKFVKKYSAFAPFGITLFVLPLFLIKSGGFSVGAVSFIKVFAVFQISDLFFYKTDNSGNVVALPPSPGDRKIFKIFPMSFFVRVWDVSSKALLIAPALRDDLLKSKGENPDGAPEGFYRRILSMLAVATRGV